MRPCSGLPKQTGIGVDVRYNANAALIDELKPGALPDLSSSRSTCPGRCSSRRKTVTVTSASSPARRCVCSHRATLAQSRSAVELLSDPSMPLIVQFAGAYVTPYADRVLQMLDRVHARRGGRRERARARAGGGSAERRRRRSRREGGVSHVLFVCRRRRRRARRSEASSNCRSRSIPRSRSISSRATAFARCRSAWSIFCSPTTRRRSSPPPRSPVCATHSSPARAR